jgi:negative regulator of flagellin synthesis FlgM
MFKGTIYRTEQKSNLLRNAMEINGKNPLTAINAGVQRLDLQQPATRTQRPGDDSPQLEPDRIELSVRSREIRNLDELIRSAPDVREARVEQIRSAIENGTYNVKAEKIAEKILGGNLIDEIF